MGEQDPNRLDISGATGKPALTAGYSYLFADTPVPATDDRCKLTADVKSLVFADGIAECSGEPAEIDCFCSPRASVAGDAASTPETACTPPSANRLVLPPFHPI